MAAGKAARSWLVFAVTDAVKFPPPRSFRMIWYRTNSEPLALFGYVHIDQKKFAVGSIKNYLEAQTSPVLRIGLHCIRAFFRFSKYSRLK